MMDLMDDDDLKKSVIDQMMGELDDETSKSLKRPAGPVKGVEIAITVAPHHGEDGEPEEIECGDEGCTNPDHHHPMGEGADMMPVEGDEDNYIGHLLKQLG